MKAKLAMGIFGAITAWLSAGAAAGESSGETLTYRGEAVPITEGLYPAGVGEAEAEEAGVRLDPPAYKVEDPERVRVVWQMRYRTVDPDGLDEVRKAWEASLPEEVDFVIEVNPRFSRKEEWKYDPNRLHEADQATLATMTAMGMGRRAHEALMEHFADPPWKPRKNGKWRKWEPTEEQLEPWGEDRRARFAEELGVSRERYLEEERRPINRWNRVLAKKLTGELNVVLREDPRLHWEGLPGGGWLPRIVVQGRWVSTPNLSGGLVGNLRAANAAIARELAGPPAIGTGPRNTEEMRRWIAATRGVVLNWGIWSIVWNEEAAELWSLSRDGKMEVVRVRKVAEDGRGWTTPEGGRRVVMWPVSGQIDAYPDGARHPAMVLADRLVGRETRMKVPGGAVTLGHGRKATDASGEEGKWWIEGGGIRFQIGDRSGGIGWREAARKAGMKDLTRAEDPRARWRRYSAWHKWKRVKGGD